MFNKDWKITVTDKTTSAIAVVTGQEVTVSGPSVIELPVARAQVRAMERTGGDLVVTTQDGQAIVVRGYFGRGMAGHSDLVFQEGGVGSQGGGTLWQANLGPLYARANGVIDMSAQDAVGVFAFVSAAPVAAAQAVASAPQGAMLAQDAVRVSSAGTTGGGGADANGGVDAAVDVLAGAAGAGAINLAWLPLSVAGVGLTATAASRGGGSSASAANPVAAPALLGARHGPPVVDEAAVQNPNGAATASGQATTAGGTVVATYTDGPAANATVSADGSYAATSSGTSSSGTASATDGSAASSASASTTTTTTTTNNGSSGSTINNGNTVTQPWIDITAPPPPVIGAVIHNADGTLTVIGTAEAGSTITVTYLDGTVASAIAGRGGSFSVTSVTAESAIAQVVATDAAHNVSAPALIPSDQTASLTAIGPDMGASGHDFITNQAHLVFGGTLSAALTEGQRAQISLDGGESWQAVTVGTDGLTWTYDNTANALPDGSYTVQTCILNANGHPAGAVSHQTVVVDTAAPTETASINAASADGLTFTGTLSAPLNGEGGSGEALQISTDGGATWQTVAAGDISGTRWTYTSPDAALGAGSHNVQARVVDAAGNAGALTTQAVQVSGGGGGDGGGGEGGGINIPTQTAQLLVISPDGGQSNSDFITNQPQLIFIGTLSAPLTTGQQVQISLDGGDQWQAAIVGSDGLTWTYDNSAITLPDGRYAVQTRVFDTVAQQAGSVTISAVPVRVDTVAPTEIVTINPTLTDGQIVSGTLSAPLGQSGRSAEILQISADGGATWQTVPASNINGVNWNYTLPGMADSYGIQARVVDVAGNRGALALQTVTAGGGGDAATAPTQTAVLTAISPDGGDSRSDFITSDNQLIFSGTLSASLAAGQQVQISLDGGGHWRVATVGAGGLTWRYDNTANPLPDSSYTVQARVFDTGAQLAGTVTSSARPVVVDTVAPTATVTLDATSADGRTFTGTVSAPLSQRGGSTEALQISTDGGATWQTVPESSILGSRWSYTSTGAALDAGNHDVQVRVADVAGNLGARVAQTVLVGTAPTQTATLTAIGPDDGTPGDFITDSNQLTFTGTLSAPLTGAQALQISLDGGQHWQNARVGANAATWAYDNASALPDGSYTVQMRVVDTASNLTGAVTSSPVPVVVDTRVPTEVIVINGLSSPFGSPADFKTASSQPTITGALSAPPGSDGGTPESVQVSWDGGQHWSAATVDGLTWTAQPDHPLSDGNYTLQVRVKDAAGNAGHPVTQAFAVVATAAATPTQTATLTAISPDTGTPGDFITDSSQVTFSGTLSAALMAGQELQISFNGFQDWRTATLGADGLTWTYDDRANGFPDGRHTVQTRVFDTNSHLAGAVSSSAQSVVVDTQAPTEVIVINGLQPPFGNPGDFKTASSQPTITGALSAPLGSGSGGGTPESVQVSWDGGQHWSAATVNGNTWTAQPDKPLSPGTYAVMAQVIDAAGNVGTPVTQSLNITEDSPAAPPTQTATLTAIGPDTGTPGDFITGNNRLTFSGTINAALTAGQQVQVSLNGGQNWQTATVGKTGLTWAYDYSANVLPDGSYTVQTRVLDTSSQLAGAVTSSSVPVVVDTKAPAETVTLDATSADGLTFTGTLSAPLNPGGGSAETLQISTDGGAHWQTVSASNLNGTAWTYTSAGAALGAGSHSVQARVVDAAGNEGAPVTQAVDVSGGSSGGNAPPAPAETDTPAPTETAPTTPTETDSTAPAETDATAPTDTHSTAPTQDTPAPAETDPIAPVETDTTAPVQTVTIAPTSADGLTFTGTLSAPLNTGSGTTEALQISTDGGKSWQTVPASDITDGTDWSYNIGGAALDAGSHSVQARVVDAAGNEGALATQAVDVDGGDNGGGSDAPAGDPTDIPADTPAGIPTATFASISPDAGDSADGFMADTASLTFAGTLSAALSGGQQLQISIDDGAWQTVPASAVTDTAWHYAPDGLTEGRHTVQVQVLDTTDNQTGTPSVAQTVVIDTTAPTETVTINPTSADGLTLTGTLSNPLNPDDNGGSAEALQISTDGGTHWQTVSVDGITGTLWTYTIAGAALGAGSHSVAARVVDAAGNEGALATQTVDVGSSAAPDADIPTAAFTPAHGDNGSGASDFITNDASSIQGTLSAPLVAGQVVQFSTDGADWHTIEDTVGALAWRYDPASALPDGDYTLHVRVLDNNTGQSNETLQSLRVDTVAPTQAAIITAVNGDALVDGGITVDSGVPVTVSGTLSAPLDGAGGSAEHVQVQINDAWHAATVDDTGLNWSVTLPALGAGLYGVFANVADQAGNAGPSSDSHGPGGALALQVGGVAMPVATLTTITPDDGASAPDFISNSSHLVFAGTLSAALTDGQQVQISLDEGAHWEMATPGADGLSWRYDSTLPDGSYAVQTRVVDPNIPSEGAVTYSAQPVVVDTAGHEGALAPQTGDAGSGSDAPADVPTDASGDDTPADISAGIPTPTFDSITPDNGPVGSDFITDAASLTFAGTLSAALSGGQQLQISLDGGTDWQTVPDGDINGTAWTYRTTGLAEGRYQVAVHVLDASTHQTGAASQDQAVVIDTTPPAEQVTGITVSSDGLTLSGDLSAPLDPGAGSAEALRVTVDGDQPQLATPIDIQGLRWTCTLDSALADGAIVQAQVQDMAGNLGPNYSYSYSYAPTAPVGDGGGSAPAETPTAPVDSPTPDTGESASGDAPTNLPTVTFASISPDTGESASDFITDATHLTFEGTLSAALSSGQQVQISLNDGANWQVVSNISGFRWTYDNATDALADGRYTVQARVTDGNGQEGAASSQSVVVDTTAPVETASIAATSDGQALTGALSAPLDQSGGSTEIVQISLDNGGTWQAATVTDTGWRYIPAADTLTPGGSYSVQARVADLAGNTGVVDTQQVQVGGDDSGSASVRVAESLTRPAIALGDDTAAAPPSGNDAVTFAGTLSAPLGQDGDATEALQISLDGGQSWQTVPASNISGVDWSYTSDGAPGAGGHAIETRVVNAAGVIKPTTVSPVSVDADDVLDLKAPEALSVAKKIAGLPTEMAASADAATASPTDGLGSGASQWHDTGTTTVNGITYGVYPSASVGANTMMTDLLAQTGIGVI